MMDKSNEARNVDSSVKTPKQEQNWLSWDIILAHENRLSEESEKIVKQKVLSVADWNTLLSYMLLSLYTKFAPRRNQDYQFMKVVKSEKQATNLDFNYYITDKHEFVFNKYKTAKAHGEQRFEVPSDLVAVIDLYLKKHPGVSKSPYFFLVNHDDTPLPSVNSVTRILNRIFGKNVGTTMLRHIYLSSKYDVAEMNKDSEQMGHTAGMQREYMKAETVNVPTL
jgi:integrase